MGIRHVSEPVGAGLSSGGTERGGGSMKVGRRFATLLAVVLAAALTLVGGRAAPSAQASTKASKVVIWTDSYRKAAVDKVTSAWGRTRGIDVDVVVKEFDKIRDNLKTVAPDNAPDVIVGAHDWTGQLAADGSVVALFPTKAIKKGFPGYALKAMAYNGKQYGIPTQLENIGLIVNTALAKVPTTRAQLESRALAFKKKGSGRIAIAVPQGSGGDAYHMYPFFSGLGGYVFGARKNGALNPQKLGVANKTFLNNASMIDKWNREGLIDSKIDYGQAKNAFLDKKAAFWITGPWETEALQKSGIKFRIVQVPKIKFRAVPFLGVQGFFVTKFAAGHGTASAAKDLVSNYMGKAGAQFDLATANSRYPANVAAGKRVHDPILSAFGKASAGRDVRRIPAVRGREIELGSGLPHVIRDEILRRRRRAVTGCELRNEEALDTEERHRTELDLRDLHDPELDAALLERLRLPRAGDPERGLLVQEGVLGLSVIDLRVDQAFPVPLVDHARIVQEGLVRNAKLLRVQGAVLPGAEHVSAQTREERVHVIRVAAAALRDRDRDTARAFLLERESPALELRPRRRDLGERRVHDQADVLELGRNAVLLPVVRHRLECVSGEALLDRLGRKQRNDRSVRRELAGPVVGTDDDVRGGVRSDRLEVVTNLVELLHDHVDVDPAGPSPRARHLVDRRLAVAVGPDDDLARLRTRLRARSRTAPNQGQRGSEDDGEQGGKAPSYLHGSSSSFSPARAEPGADWL